MSRWIWKLADNGWADWICPECGWRYNDDIHVTLDYKYCPMCGAYLGENEKEKASVFNYSSVIRRFTKRITEILKTMAQRLDKQDEEIRKLKHRMRKLENKNV